MKKSDLIFFMDRSVSEAERIAKHDDYEARKDNNLVQSRTGKFKLAELARFSVEVQS